MGYIHSAVSEICDPQSLDPICGKFDKFLAHGQAHMGQMGKWPWQCTSRGLDNSTELRMEKIRQAVTEIWVPQVWQPPDRPTDWPPIPPPARPPARTMTTMPLQPGGLRDKKSNMFTRWPFWKWHHWKSEGFWQQPQWINMHIKFEIEIPKQTWVMLLKPSCLLQKPRNRIWSPGSHFGSGILENQRASTHTHR